MRYINLHFTYLLTVLPTDIQNMLKISPSDSWATVHCQIDQLYALYKA